MPRNRRGGAEAVLLLAYALVFGLASATWRALVRPGTRVGGAGDGVGAVAADHSHGHSHGASGGLTWRGIALGTMLLAVLLLILWWTAPLVPAVPESSAATGGQAEEMEEGTVLSVQTLRPAQTGAANPAGAEGDPGLTNVVPEVLLKVRVTSGSQRGREVSLDLGGGTAPNLASAARPYSPGDRVLLAYLPAAPAGEATPSPDDGEERFRVLDHIRWPWLIGAGALFAAVVVLVARGQGARALVGLLVAVCVLWQFVIPRLLTGQAPVPVALAGCALIAIPALLVTNGWGRESVVPLAGIGGSLIVVGLLTTAAVHIAHISGMAASEELSLVYVGTRGLVNPQGLLLAGMLIGAVGALVDVTVGQSAAIFEFHDADPTASRAELFRRGMNVGRAHVAAAVHTLVLAYAGAALPLLLLIAMYAPSLSDLWNRELIGVEVLRSVTGSVGLAVSMPLTSWLACLACAPLQTREPAVIPPALHSPNATRL